MKFAKFFLMICSVALLGACGDSDNDNPAPTPAKGLMLVPSVSSIKDNGTDAVTFTVTNDGENVTAASSIFMEGQTEPLASPSFTSTKKGTYHFYATYKEERSATIDVTVVTADAPVSGELVLIASTNAIKNDGTDVCHFTVTNDGVEITSGVTIYNGKTELQSMDFTSTQTGTYTFFAAYGTSISPEVSVMVVPYDLPTLPADPNPSSTDFSQRTLAIQFTGLGCMFCPYTIAAVDQIMASDFSKDVFFAVAHSYPGDPMGGAVINALASSCSASGAPHVSIALRKVNYNNTRSIDANVASIKSQVNNDRTKHPVKAAVAASVEKIGSQIVIHTSVKAAAEGNYYVGAWLLEDGISGTQYNPEKVEGDFNTHNNVVRGVAGRVGSYNFSGDPLGQFAAGESKSFLQTIDLDNSWKAENCKVVVFVSTPDAAGESKAYVNNCAVCEIGKTVAFSYK